MKLSLELHGTEYSVETDRDEYNVDELKEIFSRMLVQATFSPEVIELAEGGRFECEYKEVDEV